MRQLLSLALGLLVALATGCASVPRPSPVLCAAIAGAAGGAGGGVIGSNNSDDDKGTDTAKGIGIGAFAGAVVGYFLCSLLPEEEPPPPPRRAAPTPPPPPPPPPEPAPEPQVKQRIVLRGVNFDFAKAEIRPDAAIILDEAARLLNQAPGTRVQVEGHTDWIGSDEFNQVLSERRADAVRRYLVQKGVGAGRLTIVGYGESRPIATNDTQEGRALNRRVELKVLGQ